MGTARDATLGFAFMRSHPAQAALVLESLEAADAAELFARAPARLGSAVLAAMVPLRAARCLAALDDARTLELLAAMGTQPALALLRHLPAARRKALIAGLPTAAAVASALLLGYAEDTLGAWADPDVVALAAQQLAADALARLRQAPGAPPQVFVLDRERRLAGVVDVGVLLAAPADATLASLMRRPDARLLAHAPLAGAAAHPGWERCSLLPVVEPGDRLVGALSRDAVARALRRAAPEPAAAGDAGLPALLARGSWQALAALAAATLTLLPSVPPLAGDDDGG